MSNNRYKFMAFSGLFIAVCGLIIGVSGSPIGFLLAALGVIMFFRGRNSGYAGMWDAIRKRSGRR